jgi:hypothetical protein
LIAYNARHVEHYPVSDEKHPEYKVMVFLVCVRDKAYSKTYLWTTEATTVQPVTDYALIGWQEAAYNYQVKWLYRPNLRTHQATLLGIHLFTVTQDNLYIGGDTQVIVVHQSAIEVFPRESVRKLEERVAEFNKALADLVLTFPQIGTGDESFKQFLDGVVEEIGQLRGRFGVATGEAPARNRALYAGEIAWRRERDKRYWQEIERIRQAATQPSESESDPQSDSQTAEGD